MSAQWQRGPATMRPLQSWPPMPFDVLPHEELPGPASGKDTTNPVDSRPRCRLDQEAREDQQALS